MQSARSAESDHNYTLKLVNTKQEKRNYDLKWKYSDRLEWMVFVTKSKEIVKLISDHSLVQKWIKCVNHYIRPAFALSFIVGSLLLLTIKSHQSLFLCQ